MILENLRALIANISVGQAKLQTWLHLCLSVNAPVLENGAID